MVAKCSHDYSTIDVKNEENHNHPYSDFLILIRKFIANLKEKSHNCYEALENLYKNELRTFQAQFPQYISFLPTFM